MVGRKNITRTLGEHGIFGDEEAAELRSELDELRAAVADLSGRVHAQFTTISAHAEIAREQAEFAREEARADLERTREAMIGLIETVRDEVAGVTGHHVPGTAPGPSIAAQNERFEMIEMRMTTLADTVERCFDRQRQLAETMEAFLDTVLAEQRREPVAGLSLA